MRKVIMAGLLTMVFMYAVPAKADTTYTYTGNTFTSFNGLSCPPDCSLDLSFTVATPLTDGSNYFTPETFTMSDGGNYTTTNSDATYESFYVDIESGIPTMWMIEGDDNGTVLITYSYGDTNSFGSVSSYDWAGSTSDTTSATNFSNPGIWAVSTPEPSTSPLFVIGLLLIGALFWRRKPAQSGL